MQVLRQSSKYLEEAKMSNKHQRGFPGVSKQTGLHRQQVEDFLSGEQAYLTPKNLRLVLMWMAGLHQDDYPPFVRISRRSS